MEAQSKDAARDGQNAVTPHLICAGAADAIGFYKEAFGAVEMVRLPGKDGKLIHACVAINGSPVMLADEFPEWGNLSPKTLGGSPVTIHLAVDDADAAAARAVTTGARVKMPVQDMFWGDRYGVIEDPFGHLWSLATPQRDAPMSEDELRQAATAAMG